MSVIELGADTVVSWATAAARTIALTVIEPDGQSVEYTPTETTGVYSATVSTPLAGRYQLRWRSTVGDPALVHSDIMDVWPADPRFLISVEDAENALSLSEQAKTAQIREDLRLYIAACTPIIEDIAGALLSASKTQVADGGRPSIILHERATQILSVEANGTPVIGTILNQSAAILYAGERGARFPSGRQAITVTYRVGKDEILPNVRLAVRHLLRHLWSVGGKPGAPKGTNVKPDGTVYTPSGFAVPKMVIELLESVHGRLSSF